MNKPAKTQLIIIIAGLAFVGWRAQGIFSKYLPAPAQAGAADAAGPAPTPAPVKATMDFSALLEAQQAVEKQPWGRDPFDASPFEQKKPAQPEAMTAKPDAKAPPAPPVTITGVSKAGTRWLAAVNGTIVGIGDTVQDKYRVVGITNSSITLVSEGWAFRYEMGEKTAQVRPWTENP